MNYVQKLIDSSMEEVLSLKDAWRVKARTFPRESREEQEYHRLWYSIWETYLDGVPHRYLVENTKFMQQFISLMEIKF